MILNLGFIIVIIKVIEDLYDHYYKNLLISEFIKLIEIYINWSEYQC